MTKNKQANDFQENRFPNICMGCMNEKNNDGTCECGYDPETVKHPSHLKSGLILNNRFIAGKVLERGGFGITYIGFDEVLNRKVAIKEYFPLVFATRDTSNLTVIPLRGDEEQFFLKGMKLFIEEAKNVAKFAKHPNIVNITDFFQENNTAYMVMDFLEGKNLSKFLKERGSPFPVKKAVNILLPILDALKDVHSIDIYHRDISPQNIVITTDGVPILIDFGAARHVVGEKSKSLDLILKPGYSPFEAYTIKGEIGSWTDVYGCGATLYFMITGKAPPPALDRVFKDELVQLSDIKGLEEISPELNNAVLHSLSVKTDDRFKTVEEFETVLLEADLSTSSQIDNNNRYLHEIEGKDKKKKTNKTLMWFFLISLLVLGVGIYYFLVSPEKSSLTLKLLPSEINSIGAKWRLENGDWQESSMVIELKTGSYIVEFMDIDGWTKPDNKKITVKNKTISEGLYTTPKHKKNASTCDMSYAQRILKKLGSYMGDINGKSNKQIRTAIKNYQRYNGLSETGDLDRKTCDLLKKEDNSL
ncbi:MAG: protein kinase [Desulfobacterales bacterium]|nr:protein kinase [Desulfobacterales bacterium]